MLLVALLLLELSLIIVKARCRFSSIHCACQEYPDESRGDRWSRLDENRCVKHINSPKTFNEAQHHCRTLTGDLVSLHGYSEMSKVICLIRRADPRRRGIWIGARRSGTVTEYIDGSEFNVPPWLYGRSNHHGSEACVKLNVKDWGSFNDIRCSKKKRFVCVKRACSVVSISPPVVSSFTPDQSSG